MGLLDPKIDKERTFALLRKKGALSATLTFSGGHDEGFVESIELELEDGDLVELPTWYCGGYTIQDREGGGYDWVPLSTPANEDEELADLLEGPINEKFGSWGNVPNTHGTLTWDVDSGAAKLRYTQDTEKDFELVV